MVRYYTTKLPVLLTNSRLSILSSAHSKVILTKVLKAAICEILDPQNVSAIQYELILLSALNAKLIHSLSSMPSCYFGCTSKLSLFIITRARASPHTRVPSTTPLLLGYEVIIKPSVHYGILCECACGSCK